MSYYGTKAILVTISTSSAKAHFGYIVTKLPAQNETRNQ